MRDYSYAKHALLIADTCDEHAFVDAFGAPKAEAASLVQSKVVVTLPLLPPSPLPSPSPGESHGAVVMEVGLEGAKALANLVILYHATLLYCAQPNDAPAEQQQAMV